MLSERAVFPPEHLFSIFLYAKLLVNEEIRNYNDKQV